MRKAFVYRLYPSKPQKQSLDTLLNLACWLYNSALQERRGAYQKQGISLNYYDQAAQLKEIRQETDLGLLNFSATQDVLRRVDKTFKSFFRRVKNGEKPGYPRFKGKNRFHSVTFPVYGDGIKITDKLYVQNVGNIKVKLHRPWEGEIKAVTVKKACDNWYVILSCLVEPCPLPECSKEVGIDVGLESFATTSDGEHIDNPRYLREAEEALADAQRRVSRRKKGSSRRRKAVRLLSKKHLKVKRTRRNFHHQIARRLVDENGFIAVEDLRIKNMIQNHCLAKSISDAGWGQFINILSTKAEEAGREFVTVNPNGTSQKCSQCQEVVSKDLSCRWHLCPSCGLSLNRDVNAARNILRLGRSLRCRTPRSSPL